MKTSLLHNSLALLVCVCVLILPLTFLLTYAVAVHNDHVWPYFPYISDTGSYSPESCIFGQLLNIAALLNFLVVYVRYHQIRDLTENYTLPTFITKLNEYAYWLGLIMGLGISVVGNFQESNVLSVHLIGALMAFGIGMLYVYAQTVISYYTSPLSCSRLTCHFRLFCSTCGAVFFILTFVFAGVSINAYSGDRRHWKEGDAGYEYHLISTISEWLMAIFFIMTVGTYYDEFTRLDMTPPTFRFSVKSNTFTKHHRHASTSVRPISVVGTDQNQNVNLPENEES